jgi:hypothetical protein
MQPEGPDYWDDVAVRSAMRSAAEVPEAMAARRALCSSLVKAFEPVGMALRCMGNMIGPGRADGRSPFVNNDVVHGHPSGSLRTPNRRSASPPRTYPVSA